VIILETERLILRTLLPSDAEAMHRYRNDPLCARYQRGQLREYGEILAQCEKHSKDVFFTQDKQMAAIVSRESGELLGEMTLFMNEPTFTLGYTVDSRFHRRGIAFEALSAMTALLHGKYPEWEIVCLVDRENKASVGLLNKLNFENMGYVEKIDSLIFALYPREDT